MQFQGHPHRPGRRLHHRPGDVALFLALETNCLPEGARLPGTVLIRPWTRRLNTARPQPHLGREHVVSLPIHLDALWTAHPAWVWSRG